MQCPSCQSLNPDDAKWCGLCLAKFDEQKGPTAPPPSLPEASHPQQDEVWKPLMPAVALPDDPQSERAWQSVADPLATETSPQVPLGTVAGRPVWACPKCSHANDMNLNICAACGTSFFERFLDPTESAPRIPKDPKTAAVLSLIPGVGHFYLGKTMEGLPRLLIALWWASTVMFIEGSNPILMSVRVLYMLATGVLIAVTALDAYREADEPGTPPVLSSRFIFYAAIGLLGLLIFGGIAAAMAFRR